ESDRKRPTATGPLSTQAPSSQSRPSTGKAPSYSIPPMPGAMPQTPGETGTSDYVMVDRGDEKQHYDKTHVKEFNQRNRENIAPQPTRRPPPQPAD
ncbi:MAG: hypothetical protein M1830_001485, partial [Pleopsidium flavum]